MLSAGSPGLRLPVRSAAPGDGDPTPGRPTDAPYHRPASHPDDRHPDDRHPDDRRTDDRRPVRLPQMPALDGLRAIAVVAVIVYHLNPTWLPGGFVGVDVFFVLSGFLITGLLLTSWERHGDLGLSSFWARRARRLLPALWVLLGGVVLAAVVFAPDALPMLRGDVLASVFYVLNWWLAFHRVSYFQSLGRPPLLLNLWSLAIEEQFYLVWPLVMLAICRWAKKTRRAVVLTAGVGALASSLAMALMFHPGTDPSVVYYGTDTHAEGLLIGCALAAVVRPGQMPKQLPEDLRRGMAVVGWGLLGVLVVMLVTLGDAATFTYRGGLVLADLVTAGVILLASEPALRMDRVLACRPLRWAGTRSYSLYLWHWPILQLTRPHIDVPFGGPGWLAVRLGLIAGAAEVSYRVVEQPFRTGAAQRWARQRWSRWRDTGHSPVAAPAVAALGLAAVVLVAIPLVTAQAPVPTGILAVGSTPAASTRLDTLRLDTLRLDTLRLDTLRLGGLPLDTLPVTPRAPAATGRGAPTRVTTPTPATTVAPVARLLSTAMPAMPAADEPILAIGDSVLLAASPTLQRAFGSAITIDAMVGRQPAEGVARLAAYAGAGRLSGYHTVLIDLGTNGPLTPAEFGQITTLTKAVPHVVFVSVHVDRSWESTSNATLRTGVPGHANMALAHWNAVVGLPGVLSPDGIHPTYGVGGQAYLRLFVDTILGRPLTGK